MKNLKYCRVGSAYRILPTTSGFCVRTALRKRAVQKSAQESYITVKQMNLFSYKLTKKRLFMW